MSLVRFLILLVKVLGGATPGHMATSSTGNHWQGMIFSYTWTKGSLWPFPFLFCFVEKQTATEKRKFRPVATVPAAMGQRAGKTN